jgi:hypothetical protein
LAELCPFDLRSLHYLKSGVLHAGIADDHAVKMRDRLLGDRSASIVAAPHRGNDLVNLLQASAECASSFSFRA